MSEYNYTSPSGPSAKILRKATIIDRMTVRITTSYQMHAQLLV